MGTIKRRGDKIRGKERVVQEEGRTIGKEAEAE